MKLNFYDKLYYIFYTLSGKKNNPEITAFMLLSLALSFLILIAILIILVVLKDDIDYKTFILQHADTIPKIGLGGGFIILLVNIFIFIKRGPLVISEIESNKQLSDKLRSKRIYIIFFAISFFVLSIGLSKYLGGHL